MRLRVALAILAAFVAGLLIDEDAAGAPAMAPAPTVHDRAYDITAYAAGILDRPRVPVPVTAPQKPVQPRTRVAAPTEAGTVNGYPCGGSLPPCRVLACESGGNPTAQNPTSSASGLWQVLVSTWGGFGGYPEAWLAPADVQNEHARILWAGGRGASHWASCL